MSPVEAAELAKWYVGFLPYISLAYWYALALFGVAYLKRMGRNRVSSGVLALMLGLLALVPVLILASRYSDLFAWPRCLPRLAVATIVFVCLPYLVRQTEAAPTGWLLAALVYLALNLRFERLFLVHLNESEPDVKSFLSVARSMSWFYDTQHRDPLYIFLIKLATAILGEAPIVPRVVSLLASLALVLVVYWAGKELASAGTGLIAAALTAGSPALVALSVRGFRFELFTISLVLIAGIVLSRQLTSGPKFTARLGAATAMCVLTRVTSLWFCLIAIAYGCYRRGWSTKQFACTAAIPVVAVLPYLVYCAVEFGDPLLAVNHHIQWYHKHEYANVPAELENNANVEAVGYFFDLHSPLELIRRGVTQFSSILFGEMLTVVCGGSTFLYWWALAALVYVCFTPYRFLVAWIVLTIGPIVWLYSSNFGPEQRLVLHYSVLVYLAMGLLAEKVWSVGSPAHTHSPSANTQIAAPPLGAPSLGNATPAPRTTRNRPSM